MKKLAALLLLAAIAGLSRYPQAFIEREYSRGLYPEIQSTVTMVSNVLPIAFLDVIVALLLIAALIAFRRVARRQGRGHAFGRLNVWLLTTVAVIYLLFLATWGLNYHRVPLEAQLDFDRGRITEAAAVQLASTAIERLNTGYASAHRGPLVVDALKYAFYNAQEALGAPRYAELGTPKRSLLQWYFRKAAINGMTVPVVLEVILNPDLLPAELPSTLAHEWAHLAGYADESEANFLAWYACVSSEDALVQYSGWIDAYTLAVNALPRTARSTLPPLHDGPRRDLREIAERYERSSPRVRRAARDVYDSYLKANRVEEGIASYGAALQLMLGTRFEQNWKPVRKVR